MQFTREQARSLSGGGSTFFKLEDGKSALVRFLYNSLEEMIPVGAHVVKQNEGDRFGTTILCARETQDDPLDKCKYCASGNNVLARYVIPMYNEDTHEIQYWLRTSNFEKILTSQVDELNPQQPISGQIFKIKRVGNGTDTVYQLFPTGNNDGKTKDQFGEIKPISETNVIRPANYEFPVNNNGGYNNFSNQNNVYGGNQQFGGQPNQFGGNQGFGGQQFNSTRRTTDMF